MSWAAHELESYLLQKHVRVKISYLAVLIGCLLPDLFTKLPVYGLHVAHMTLLKASAPYKYHRGWPGVGFTHTLSFGLVFATVVLIVGKNRAWFIGLLIGSFAHVLTDMFDSVGTMVFFPFTLQHYSVGMWAYASQEGRYGDAAAYYSSLGGVWDTFWLCLTLTGVAVFTGRYFLEKVEPNDPVWGWVRRRFNPKDRVLVAAYRAYFVYGACRIFAWFAWARLLNPSRGVQVLDLRWGGPTWAWPTIQGPLTAGRPAWSEFLLTTVRAGTLWITAVAAAWWFIIRRFYVRAS